MIDKIFNNAMDSISDDDKTLPQIEHLLPLLKRGIGIHHGGLLPILKEVIEILFQEGLIKVFIIIYSSENKNKKKIKLFLFDFYFFSVYLLLKHFQWD